MQSGFNAAARARHCMLGEGAGGRASAYSHWDPSGAMQPSAGAPLPSVLSEDDTSDIAEQKTNLKTSRAYSRPSLKFSLPCLVLQSPKYDIFKGYIAVLSCYLRSVFIAGVCFVFNHHPDIATP